MADRIQLRRDTATNWASVNPVLAQGELGVETDTLKFKCGNGTTAWNSLLYLIDAGNYATKTGTETLTNKTLTSPSITGGTVDGAPIGFRNIPPVGTKNSSYTLTTADVGEYVQIGSGGSITIPDAVFAEGDVVSLFNNTSGTVTITCSITTAYIGGADADKATMTLAARGVATILFISGTVCVVNGNVV